MGWHTEKNKFSAISVPVLVRRATVRQAWVRFPHWSPPSAQQEEIIHPCTVGDKYPAQKTDYSAEVYQTEDE